LSISICMLHPFSCLAMCPNSCANSYVGLSDCYLVHRPVWDGSHLAYRCRS
jgi:hypothetical protein